jgi:hypothetical protein
VSEEGGKCGAISGRGGVIGSAAAHVGGGGSGAQSGFRRKKTAGRLTGWARLSVRGRRRGRLGRKGRERGGPRLGRNEEGKRWAAARPEGGEREVGRGWAENQKWLDKILSNFIWNLDFLQTLEICMRGLRRNFHMGILPKIF